MTPLWAGDHREDSGPYRRAKGAVEASEQGSMGHGKSLESSVILRDWLS